MRRVIRFQVLPAAADGDSSLVVLMDDGTLHEYAVNPDTDEKVWTELELPAEPEPAGEGA